MNKTCQLCGRTAKDVQKRLEHVGGHGTIPTGPLCENRGDCWARWNRANHCKNCVGILIEGDEADRQKCIACATPHTLKGEIVKALVISGDPRSYKGGETWLRSG